MYRQRTRALPARAPAGFSSARSPGRTGTRIKSSALLRAEARAAGHRSIKEMRRGFRRPHKKAMTTRVRAGVGATEVAMLFERQHRDDAPASLCSRFGFCAQERAALRAPSAAVNGGRISPQGRAQGCARVRRRRRKRRRRTPAAVHAPVGQDARRAPLQGRPSLWLLSLGQARESDRPAGMRDEHAGTRVGFREGSFALPF